MPVAAFKPISAIEDVRLIGGNINGRYTLAGESGLRCFACRVQSVSTRMMSLTAPVSGAVGENIGLYFDSFGMLRGQITRLRDFGFVIDIVAADEDRARIAAKIRWLRKRVIQEAPDKRGHKRFLPRSPRSSLLLASGQKIECFIIDMSSSGVAVSADFTPQLGEPLAVGRVVGRVVRHLDVGFAVQFIEVQPVEGLEAALATIEVGMDAAGA